MTNHPYKMVGNCKLVNCSDWTKNSKYNNNILDSVFLASVGTDIGQLSSSTFSLTKSWRFQQQLPGFSHSFLQQTWETLKRLREIDLLCWIVSLSLLCHFEESFCRCELHNNLGCFVRLCVTLFGCYSTSVFWLFRQLVHNLKRHLKFKHAVWTNYIICDLFIIVKKWTKTKKSPWLSLQENVVLYKRCVYTAKKHKTKAKDLTREDICLKNRGKQR